MRVTKQRGRPALALLSLGVLSGCPAPVASDAGKDGGVDAAREAAAEDAGANPPADTREGTVGDATADVAGDAGGDAGVDVGLDVGEDAAEDVGLDVGEAAVLDAAPDVALDAAEDAATDGGALAIPDGSVDAAGPTFTVSGAVATVVRGDPTLGTAYTDACPAGSILAGLDLFWTGYLLGIIPVCGPVVLPAGTGEISKGTLHDLEFRGTPGQSPLEILCPPNSAVVGFNGRSGFYIDALSLNCAPLSVTGAAPYTFALGPTTTTAQGGGTGGSPFPTTNCPAGQVAYKTYIRVGHEIDAFGLVCGTPTAR